MQKQDFKPKYTSDFVVEDLGIQELEVYDIEVEDNHNFFANNICVHNSLYFSFEGIAQRISNGKHVSADKMTDAIDKFFESKVQPMISKGYKELQTYTGTKTTHLEMAREVIATAGLWKAKKAYALNVIDAEHVRFAEPYQKVMGLAAVKAETPEMCRKAIKEVLKLILTSTEKNVQAYLRSFKKQFWEAPVDDIAKNVGVKDMETYQTDCGFLTKTPYHVKASMCYNRLIDKYNIGGKYNKILSGDKVKLIYISPENQTGNNVFAYPEFIPKEMDMVKYIDRKNQYEKVFFKSTKELVELANMKPIETKGLF